MTKRTKMTHATFLPYVTSQNYAHDMLDENRKHVCMTEGCKEYATSFDIDISQGMITATCDKHKDGVVK